MRKITTAYVSAVSGCRRWSFGMFSFVTERILFLSNAYKSHAVPAHHWHAPAAPASYWVCVIPWSTATKHYDADKSCHLNNIIQGRMRTPTYRQTNGAAGLCGGSSDCYKKVLGVSFQISTKSAEARGKRSPESPLGQQQKGWMNSKQTCERLQWPAELPRGCWTDDQGWWWWWGLCV